MQHGSVDLTTRLDTAAFDHTQFAVAGVTGQEEMSKPFWFDIDIVAREASLDPDAAIGGELTMILSDGDAEVRRVHGMITRIERLPFTDRAWRGYRLRLEPRLMRSAYISNNAVFVDTHAGTVIEGKLDKCGLKTGVSLRMSMSTAPPKRSQIIQYRESDYAFVCRLMERYGLSYYFLQNEAGDVMVVSDGAQGYPDLGALPIAEDGGLHGVAELTYRRQLTPRVFVARDYYHRTPNVQIKSSSVRLEGGDIGGIVNYGAHLETVDEATAHATQLSERAGVERSDWSATSDLPQLSVGHQFSLTEHPDEPPALLIVKIEHAWRHPVEGVGVGEAKAYRNAFTAIDVGRRFRPAQTTPVPRIHGLVNGVVQTDAVGTLGRTADLDSDGFYLVKFRFDGSATAEQQAASCRIRMIQQSAGAGYGTHFPLKPGVEVLVGFVGGDPDRPLIVGAAPNAVTPSPVRSTNANKNRIRTRSGALIEIDDGA